ncbi:NADH dehydrogenase subunit E [Rosistilla ulvae]|uniref:NADH dehydrogenase subunit E n=1 Tax=Rosistilla ulvae TaxID=1930277 RepID=A0A517M6A3_9BACT|nr:hypothetical protein [Rosistilla ulvae]QDS90387.1 NADH dehydrogenase subunit E [Rosistilla ulvae]
MFIARLDYAMTHLGWLGFLTAVYFAGIGIWLAQLLWRRNKAAVWQDRSEIYAEYRDLHQRSLENQTELLEACEIHETSLLQREAQLDETKKQLGNANGELVDAKRQLDETKHRLVETESQLAEAKSQLGDTQKRLADAEAKNVEQQIAADKQEAGHQCMVTSWSQQVAKLDAALALTANDAKAAQERYTQSTQELSALRTQYAELTQQLADAENEQVSMDQVDREYDRLRGHLATLRQQLESTQANLVEREQRCERLSEQLQEAQDDLKLRGTLLEDLRELQTATVAKLNAVRQTDETLAQLQAERDQLQEKFHAVEFELEAALRNGHAAEQEVGQVADQLAIAAAASEADRAEDQSQIAALRRQLADVESRLDAVVHRPDDADDLTEIFGVSRRLEDQLNEAGVFRFEQMAEWTNREKCQFERLLGRLGCVRDGKWCEQAKELLTLADESGERTPEPVKPKATSYLRALRTYGNVSVTVDETLGVVFTRRPSYVDDLTVVRGIGHVNQRCLRKAGVYRLQQIADWNEYNVWAFNELLSFKGRIERENWVGQAQDVLAFRGKQDADETMSISIDSSSDSSDGESSRAAA